MFIESLIGLAVFGSDLYTCVLLLGYSKWASNVQPSIPFHISRWIFSACILFSIVWYIYEIAACVMIVKTKVISLAYTNPMAKKYYSYKGFGYFCLFEAITGARNFQERVTLFVYFSMKGIFRLLIADSPRQVLNGITLYSVLQLSDDFVGAVKRLATSSYQEAVVICFMTFAFTIWVIRILSLLTAFFCVIPVYMHVKHNTSGNEKISLERYICKRINQRIKEIVKKQHQKGLVDVVKQNKDLKMRPTLPIVDLEALYSSDSRSEYSKKDPFASSANLLSTTTTRGAPNETENDLEYSHPLRTYSVIKPSSSQGFIQNRSLDPSQSVESLGNYQESIPLVPMDSKSVSRPVPGYPKPPERSFTDFTSSTGSGSRTLTNEQSYSRLNMNKGYNESSEHFKPLKSTSTFDSTITSTTSHTMTTAAANSQMYSERGHQITDSQFSMSTVSQQGSQGPNTRGPNTNIRPPYPVDANSDIYPTSSAQSIMSSQTNQSRPGNQNTPREDEEFRRRRMQLRQMLVNDI